jgi:hypothetical protein
VNTGAFYVAVVSSIVDNVVGCSSQYITEKEENNFSFTRFTSLWKQQQKVSITADLNYQNRVPLPSEGREAEGEGKKEEGKAAWLDSRGGGGKMGPGERQLQRRSASPPLERAGFSFSFFHVSGED